MTALEIAREALVTAYCVAKHRGDDIVAYHVDRAIDELDHVDRHQRAADKIAARPR